MAPSNQAEIVKLQQQVAALTTAQASATARVGALEIKQALTNEQVDDLNGWQDGLLARVVALESAVPPVVPPPVIPPPVVPPVIPPVVPPVVPTDPPDTGLVPAESRTTWAPGVQGGIPDRLVYAAIPVNPEVNRSEIIQVALDACPAGMAILLGPGTFIVNDFLLLGRGITLRWPKVDDATSVNLLHDGVKGSHVITLANASGFAPGQIVFLDEDDWSTAEWLPCPPRAGATVPSRVWGTDRIVFAKHDPRDPAPADGHYDPASPGWFSRYGRPLCEIKQIASIDGNTITFTTPLHADYYVTKLAQLTRFDSVHVQGAGIEDMTILGGGDGNVIFNAAAQCWMKNVELTAWTGPAVRADQSFRCEIRDSYIHDGVHPYPGGAGYNISLAAGSSEILIENNISSGTNKVMVVRSAGAGSVVGYNYMDNGQIGNYLDWVEVGINGSHMVGGHHILFEGNQSCNYDSDDTWGNAICMTIFRNHLVGRRRNFPGQVNARCAGLMFGSWWHSFIGNVLGEDGQMAGWTYDTWNPNNGVGSIWKFGYAPSMWSQAADPKVLSTVLRDGNFDYLTKSTQWDRAPQELPDSLYLTSKPAFFGDLKWPWVNPSGWPAVLYTLPARARFEALGR